MITAPVPTDRRDGRRDRRHLGSVGALLVGVVLTVACGTTGNSAGGSDAGVPTTEVAAPAGLIERAAEATAAAGTARFVIEARLSTRATSVVASRSEGEVDLAGPRGVRRDAAISSLTDPGAKDELVAVAVVWFDSSGSRQQEIDAGRPGRVEPVTGGLGAFLGLDTRVEGDPAAVLSAELGGRVYVEAGSEQVRGVEATHVRSAAAPRRRRGVGRRPEPARAPHPLSSRRRRRSTGHHPRDLRLRGHPRHAGRPPFTGP